MTRIESISRSINEGKERRERNGARRVCLGSATPTDRGRTRPFSNEDAASHGERASTRSNTATRRLAPRRRAHWLSFPPFSPPTARVSLSLSVLPQLRLSKGTCTSDHPACSDLFSDSLATSPRCILAFCPRKDDRELLHHSVCSNSRACCFVLNFM